MQQASVSQRAELFSNFVIDIADTITADGEITQNVTIPAAKLATVDVYVDDSQVDLVFAEPHGWTVSEDITVDLFWGDGQHNYSATATVTSTSGITVAPSTGLGNTFTPSDETNATEVTVSKVVNVDLDVNGDLAKVLAVASTQPGCVQFRAASGPILICELDGANQGYVWSANTGVANPLASNVLTHVYMGNASLVSDATVQLGVLYDSIL